MIGVLDYLKEVLGWFLNLSIIILFYLSLKKCFLKEGDSKVKLFFVSFFTGPIALFVIAFFSSLIVFLIVISFVFDTDARDKAFESLRTASGVTTSLMILTIGIVFVLMVIISSYIVGKRLKVSNVSLVMFVYLMFTVVYSLNSNISAKNPDYELLYAVVRMSSQIFSIVGVWLMYVLVINELSKLTDRKRQINARIFLIPPIIFEVTYFLLDYYTSTKCSDDANLLVQVLSWIILTMFIWAFYVIIKNIKATNEANDAKDEIKDLSVEVMEALAHTIDAKDRYTNGHSMRVAKYSRMIAQKMGMSDDFCENIYYMGLLHDIGKIGVPNEIINKPSSLTDEEYDIIKTHPGIGCNILSEIKSNPELAKGARWHHERYDGKGYPDKKSGEEIPLEARIIAVADSYDAMSSNRSYRSYLPQDVCRAEIEKNIGTQFDPEAARCMLLIIDEDKEYELHEKAAENVNDINKTNVVDQAKPAQG